MATKTYYEVETSTNSLENWKLCKNKDELDDYIHELCDKIDRMETVDKPYIRIYVRRVHNISGISHTAFR